LLLFRELAVQGDLTVTAILREIPPLADFEPFGVYGGWQLTLSSTTASDASIREVFEFVEGNCDLEIVQLIATTVLPTPPRAPVQKTVDTFDALRVAAPPPSPPERERPAATITPIPAPAVMPEPDPKPLPEPVLRSVEPSPAPEAPAAIAGPDHDRRVGEPDRRNAISSIRVDLEKVDRVVDMVGELVIIQSMLTQQMDEESRARYQELVRGLEVLAQTTRGLQDAVMAIRAQPVKSVFSRMPRLVRELAQLTGKKLKLETVGEGTEIDKTVIEQLSDPLTHMIRNSADHGIELPETRAAMGKPETGIVRLSAEQAGGSILIVVEDDGAGINRERVLEVARRRGVITAEQQLTEEQIDNLIFAPGFSTAEAVSDISGRGVGMDVVLSNIKKIGGSVQVKSVPGRGTRMTLRLPLTLAVLDVMQVKVGASPYVIPITSIVETIQCSRADFGRAPSGAQVLRVRGDYVQVIDLAGRFGIHSAAAMRERFVVLCEAEGAVRVALIVDDIVGQQQVVIKSLEENFERVEGIAGGTILGDGNVALIIDVQGLRAQTQARRAA
jgi:two-component system chemotaxis sensor kinase CheA